MSSRFLTPPVTPIDAVVRVPGSKSVANRALVCAMLAGGESIITGLPDGDDTAVILEVLSQTSRLQRLADDAVMVAGNPTGKLPGIVDAALAGTSSRFLTAIAALGESTSIIDGGEPLRSRPMQHLHHALSSLGADITPLGVSGHLPVSVSRGQLVGGRVSIRGDVSSQFISALMLIGPVLPQGLSIDIEGELVSRSYVEMTATVMRDFGALVSVEPNVIVVSASGYASREYAVEPDYSSAAFPIAAVLIRGGSVTIPGLAKSVMQGDAAMADIARSMGGTVQVTGTDIVVSRESGQALKPISMNMEDCSDLVPAVAAACAVALGSSTITGVGFIRRKESDRLGDLAAEMRKAGVAVEVNEDGLTINGSADLSAAEFDPHHDHRLAMALALLSLVSKSATVNDSEVVSKSWPSYFEDMAPILG
jgi:3-phosphoshikimate 1-carboxyvinyltransferase